MTVPEYLIKLRSMIPTVEEEKETKELPSLLSRSKEEAHKSTKHDESETKRKEFKSRIIFWEEWSKR